MLNAYRDGSVDKIKNAISTSSCVRFLDVSFSRLAAKLPNPAHELGALAVKMGVEGVDGDATDEDDDLT